MAWIPDRYRELRSWLKGEDVDAEIEEEFRHHLDLLTEENVARGMNPAVVVRTAGPPRLETLAPAIEQVLRGMDPTVPVGAVETLDGYVRSRPSIVRREFTMTLMAVAGGSPSSSASWESTGSSLTRWGAARARWACAWPWGRAPAGWPRSS